MREITIDGRTIVIDKRDGVWGVVVKDGPSLNLLDLIVDLMDRVEALEKTNA